MPHKNHNRRQRCTANCQESNQTKIDQIVDKLFRLTTQQNDENVAQKFKSMTLIYELLNEIRLMENDSEKNDNSRRSDTAILSRFTQWVTENGANFDGLKIAEFDGYELGLLAETDIEKSSLIIAVPETLMMTVDAAERSELGHLMKVDPMLKNMANVSLAVFLLLEKFNGKSFWKPYIDILPTIYSTILYFGLDELQELQVSPTFESALKQIENIVRQYAYFYKLIWNSNDAASRILRKRFTFNQYRWAVSTVMTRQNSFLSTDVSKCVTSLIPLWDLCNHMNGYISTSYNPTLKRSECLAIKDFKAGEQLFIFYGARSNAELFIHNGFVYEDNEHDTYKLKLGVSKSDPLKDQRVRLLAKLSLQDHSEYIIRLSHPPIDIDLLAFLRIFNMDKDQLQYWLDNPAPQNLKSSECAFETSFEKKCWGFLLTRLKLILASYKTTLEEDTKLMSDGILSRNKRLAIQMRAADKRILIFAINYAEERVKC